MNPVSIILRAALAGAAAGALAALFFLTIATPTLDEAIAFEERATTASTDDTPAGPEISRQTQALGGVVAAVLYGALVGVVFGTIFSATRHRLPASSDFGRCFQCAAIGFFAVVALPAIKYPANPPGVGDPDNVNQRTLMFFTLVLAGLLIAAGAVSLYGWLADRFRISTAQLGAITAAIGATVAVMLAWPDANTAIPADFPADLLWRFRLQSIGTLFITWTGLGLMSGWLISLLAPHPSTASDD